MSLSIEKHYYNGFNRYAASSVLVITLNFKDSTIIKQDVNQLVDKIKSLLPNSENIEQKISAHCKQNKDIGCLTHALCNSLLNVGQVELLI